MPESARLCTLGARSQALVDRFERGQRGWKAVVTNLLSDMFVWLEKSSAEHEETRLNAKSEPYSFVHTTSDVVWLC